MTGRCDGNLSSSCVTNEKRQLVPLPTIRRPRGMHVGTVLLTPSVGLPFWILQLSLSGNAYI